jgi:hypothetical protein
MAFVAFALAAFFTILLWLVSGWFRPRFHEHERVVMQWSLSGKPNSYASPRVALAVTPGVGTVSLFLLAGLTSFSTPQEDWGAALSAIAAIGAVLVTIHILHMHFAAKSGGR